MLTTTKFTCPECGMEESVEVEIAYVPGDAYPTETTPHCKECGYDGFTTAAIEKMWDEATDNAAREYLDAEGEF